MLRRTRIASQVSVHKCCLVCYDFGVVALLSLDFFRGVSSPVSRGLCFSSCSASMAFFVMVILSLISSDLFNPVTCANSR